MEKFATLHATELRLEIQLEIQYLVLGGRASETCSKVFRMNLPLSIPTQLHIVLKSAIERNETTPSLDQQAQGWGPDLWSTSGLGNMGNVEMDRLHSDRQGGGAEQQIGCAHCPRRYI